MFELSASNWSPVPSKHSMSVRCVCSGGMIVGVIRGSSDPRRAGVCRVSCKIKGSGAVDVRVIPENAEAKAGRASTSRSMTVSVVERPVGSGEC